VDGKGSDLEQNTGQNLAFLREHARLAPARL
jgi:hypothetical protein